METNMRGVKQEYRIAEWTRLIRECVSSGMSAKAWCEAQGIKKRTYYYWQKKVREAAVETAVVLGKAVDTPPPTPGGVPSDAPEFVCIVPEEGSPVAGCRAPAMTIRTGSVECVVYGGADPGLVARALSALVTLI